MKRSSRLLTGMTAIASLLTVTACSDDDRPAVQTTVTQTVTVTPPTPSETPSVAPTTPVASPTVDVQQLPRRSVPVRMHKPAAPKAAGSFANTDYDASQKAANIFAAWWDYEATASDKRNTPVQVAYAHGHNQVCKWVEASTMDTSPLIEKIQTLGYTTTGAEALLVAANEALCTPHGNVYFTRFDLQVDNEVASANPDDLISALRPLGWVHEPPWYAYGDFMRWACGYVGSHSALTATQVDAAVNAQVKNLRLLMQHESYNTLARVTFVEESVHYGCPTYGPRIPWHSPWIQ